MKINKFTFLAFSFFTFDYLQANTIEEVYEPFLVQEGYIKRTQKGRVATISGYEHLGLKPDRGYQNSMFE